MTSNKRSIEDHSTESLPLNLIELSLQNRLRIIGQQLDRNQYHNVSLMEVSGGILVKVCKPGDLDPRIFEYKDEVFPTLIGRSVAGRGEDSSLKTKSSLLPTGYEDFLRALGYELDRLDAENVVITEFVNYVTVTGVAPVSEGGSTTNRTFSYAVNSTGIQKLLAAAIARRNVHSPGKGWPRVNDGHS